MVENMQWKTNKVSKFSVKPKFQISIMKQWFIVLAVSVYCWPFKSVAKYTNDCSKMALNQSNVTKNVLNINLLNIHFCVVPRPGNNAIDNNLRGVEWPISSLIDQFSLSSN